MQCKFLPIALSSKTAATLESTPPESPKITFSSNTSDFNSLTVLSIKDSGFHSLINFNSSMKKFSNIFRPLSV